MPWGRIDDGFYDHPKLDRLGKDRLSAVGLHWLAVSWSNRWLTDGAITRERVGKLGGTTLLADTLVDAGLWDRDGDGYRIHDFLEFNESKADVEAKRLAERDKKRNARAKGAAAVSHDAASGRFSVSPGVSPRDTAGTPSGSPPLTVPLPSRPDHTEPRDAHDVMLLVERLTTYGFDYRQGHRVYDTLVKDCEVHGVPRIVAEYERFRIENPGPMDPPQLVFGVHNLLHPFKASAPAKTGKGFNPTSDEAWEAFGGRPDVA